MSNLQTLLKEAMAKVSRKQIRLLVGNQKHQIIELRRSLSVLRTRLDQADKRIRSIQITAANVPAAPQSEPETVFKRRITGKRIRVLRRKLGLTQTEMAKLAHVTTQAVYLWERKAGPIRLRETTRAELSKLQGIGRREASAMLAASATARRKPGRPPKAAKPGRKPGRKLGRRAKK